ncbi:MAG: hypothetical protein Q8R47_06665 [Nanoarchaeota archaeon]|nr:hypothetical protein [Nanoarchaeota archaeon]
MKKYLRNNMNLFDKVEWVKQLSSEAIGVTDNIILKKMLRRLCDKSKVSAMKYGVLRFSQQELILDQLLKDNEVSPRSAYRWFSLLQVPENVRQLGEECKISQNEIMHLSSNERLKSDPEHEKLGKEILQDIIRIVEMM